MGRDYKLMNKDLIKKRFSKSLKTYNDNAHAQNQMARRLVYEVNNNFKSVLELGCGTGFVTSEIFSDELECYDAIDIVKGCEKYTKNLSEKINFICDDIETYTPTRNYDLIISNATIQWIENLTEFIDKYMKYLNSDGVFGFTLFGKDNYIELKSFVDSGLKYYSTDEIKTLFKKYKIKLLKEEIITLEFSNVKEVLYHIKNTGVNALNETRWSKSDLIKFEKEYPKKDDKITLTYNPIYVILEHL